jgi:hypothetical protein
MSVDQNLQLAWTLSPSSLHGGLPPAVSFFWENTTVFFAEIIPEQLRPNGTGLGTFNDDTTMSSIDSDDPVFNQTAPILNVDPGSILRYVAHPTTVGCCVLPGTFSFPRWGIRISCAKIPNGDANMSVSIAVFHEQSPLLTPNYFSLLTAFRFLRRICHTSSLRERSFVTSSLAWAGISLKALNSRTTSARWLILWILCLRPSTWIVLL